jgi:hypothetical protein
VGPTAFPASWKRINTGTQGRKPCISLELNVHTTPTLHDNLICLNIAPMFKSCHPEVMKLNGPPPQALEQYQPPPSSQPDGLPPDKSVNHAPSAQNCGLHAIHECHSWLLASSTPYPTSKGCHPCMHTLYSCLCWLPCPHVACTLALHSCCEPMVAALSWPLLVLEHWINLVWFT